jgi:hypothetical protein
MQMGSGETHLLDNTLPRADGAAIVERVLRKVRLRCGGPMLNLVYRSLKLGLADGHGSELKDGSEKSDYRGLHGSGGLLSTERYSYSPVLRRAQALSICPRNRGVHQSTSDNMDL